MVRSSDKRHMDFQALIGLYPFWNIVTLDAKVGFKWWKQTNINNIYNTILSNIGMTSMVLNFPKLVDSFSHRSLFLLPQRHVITINLSVSTSESDAFEPQKHKTAEGLCQ